MKKIFLLVCCLILPLLQAQTLKSSQKLGLKTGETVIQIEANYYAYAACAVGKSQKGAKEYNVIASYGRLGPFSAMKSLQFTDRGVAVFAAEDPTGWYVFEGMTKYGPYKSVTKLASGLGGFGFVYIAEKDGFSELFYNGKGTGKYASDFLLSSDGKEIIYVKTNSTGQEKTVCWKNWTSAPLSEVMNLTISPNGMEIGFFSKLQKPFGLNATNDTWSFNFIRQSPGKPFSEFSKGDYRYPGPVYFKPNPAGIYAVYAALRAEGMWEIRSETDKLLAETGQVSALSYFQEELIYAAKPLDLSGPDSARYKIYYKGAVAGGPYDDVRAIGTSIESLSLVVRSAAHWYIVMTSGSFGPFADIRFLDSWNAGMFAYSILNEQEWTGCIGTDSQVGLGCMIKESGKPCGYAFCDGNTIQIYSMP